MGETPTTDKLPVDVLCELRRITPSQLVLVAEQVPDIETLVAFFKTGKIDEVFDFGVLNDFSLSWKLAQLFSSEKLCVLWFHNVKSIHAQKSLLDELEDKEVDKKEQRSLFFSRITQQTIAYHPQVFANILKYLAMIDPKKDPKLFSDVKRELLLSVKLYDDFERDDKNFITTRFSSRSLFRKFYQQLIDFFGKKSVYSDQLIELGQELYQLLKPLAVPVEMIFVSAELKQLSDEGDLIKYIDEYPKALMELLSKESLLPLIIGVVKSMVESYQENREFGMNPPCGRDKAFFQNAYYQVIPFQSADQSLLKVFVSACSQLITLLKPAVGDEMSSNLCHYKKFIFIPWQCFRKNPNGFYAR